MWSFYRKIRSHKRQLNLLVYLGLLVLALPAHAVDLQPFRDGSMQMIEKRYQNQAFVVALWSLTCPPCLHELQMLGEWQQQNAGVPLVLISTDVDQDMEQVRTVLATNGLSDADHWIFADNYLEKLRFQIDPAWHGELPRSYLYSASGERRGISGRLTEPMLVEWLNAQATQEAPDLQIAPH